MTIIINEIRDFVIWIAFLLPGKLGSLLRKFIGKILFKKFSVGARLGQYTSFVAAKNISLDSNVTFDSYCYLNSEGGEITIGAKTSFNRNVSLNASVGGCIEIGKDCLIGPGAYFRTASHKYKNRNVAIKNQGHKVENIIIGTNVWLGANVVVLPGVKIGDGCVVAAGTVLTKSFSKNQIIAGVPAKSIGQR